MPALFELDVGAAQLEIEIIEILGTEEPLLAELPAALGVALGGLGGEFGALERQTRVGVLKPRERGAALDPLSLFHQHGDDLALAAGHEHGAVLGFEGGRGLQPGRDAAALHDT